tara:strand:+ start:3675 stop:4181 length:507 start_codon:yes stop_codon:yes gene_type:complete
MGIHAMTERQKSLLVLNGIGLLISSALSGWLHFFQLLGEIDLWPFINHIEAQVPGESRAWVMAHLEGITNGLLLMAIACCSGFLALSIRQSQVLFYSALTFGWLFTLPAIANAWFGTRGLAYGGGPWGPSLANDIIFVIGWLPMIAVHIAFPLLAYGAWKHYRNLQGA